MIVCSSVSAPAEPTAQHFGADQWFGDPSIPLLTDVERYVILQMYAFGPGVEIPELCIWTA